MNTQKPCQRTGTRAISAAGIATRVSPDSDTCCEMSILTASNAMRVFSLTLARSAIQSLELIPRWVDGELKWQWAKSLIIAFQSTKDLSYKDKHWHEACFLCQMCRISLVDKQFGSKSDKIYCGNCYDSQFASRCDGCGEVFRAGECSLNILLQLRSKLPINEVTNHESSNGEKLLSNEPDFALTRVWVWLWD